MSLSLDDLATWLAAEGVTTPVQINRLQDTPDKVIAISVPPAGGSALMYEGAFIGTKTHFRCRASNDEDAEALAKQVFELVSAQGQSFWMGARNTGTYVLYAEPIGQDAYLGQDDSLRSTYLLECEFVIAV